LWCAHLRLIINSGKANWTLFAIDIVMIHRASIWLLTQYTVLSFRFVGNWPFSIIINQSSNSWISQFAWDRLPSMRRWIDIQGLFTLLNLQCWLFENFQIPHCFYLIQHVCSCDTVTTSDSSDLSVHQRPVSNSPNGSLISSPSPLSIIASSEAMHLTNSRRTATIPPKKSNVHRSCRKQLTSYSKTSRAWTSLGT
jgi:hypothetical protein